MNKRLLFWCALFATQMAFAQSHTGLSIGISGEYGYQSLRGAYDWAGDVEGYLPGTFRQVGLDLEWRSTGRIGVQSGLKYARYQYTEQRFGLPDFQDGLIICCFGCVPMDENVNRTFNAINVPLLLTYHLQDLIPGKLHLAVHSGLNTNVMLNRRDGEEFISSFAESLRPISFDGQLGAAMYWNAKWGTLTLGPVFRMALSNYANDPQFDHFEKPSLRPYSMSLRLGYLWKL